jgi:hypothetical protein
LDTNIELSIINYQLSIINYSLHLSDIQSLATITLYIKLFTIITKLHSISPIYPYFRLNTPPLHPTTMPLSITALHNKLIKLLSFSPKNPYFRVETRTRLFFGSLWIRKSIRTTGEGVWGISGHISSHL